VKNFSDGEGSDGEGSDGEGSDGEGSDGEGSDGEGSDGEGSDGSGGVITSSHEIPKFWHKSEINVASVLCEDMPIVPTEITNPTIKKIAAAPARCFLVFVLDHILQAHKMKLFISFGSNFSYYFLEKTHSLLLLAIVKMK
jgi:hypothetical protein